MKKLGVLFLLIFLLSSLVYAASPIYNIVPATQCTLDKTLFKISNANGESTNAHAELYNANLRLMNISKRRSVAEYESYKAEAEGNKSEVVVVDSVSKQLESKVLYYDSLLNITETKTPIGYKAVCLYQLRRKDRSVSKDTANILMNLDKNIVREEDFIKLP